MTFGEIKTITENYLLSSFGNKKIFKEALKDFKKDVLENKKISKLYALYEELTSPQGLNDEDAEMFLNEGIKSIQKIISETELPKVKFKHSLNNYKELDSLVYDDRVLEIKNRIQNRKKILSLLKEEKPIIKESVNIPISSMMNIANKKISEYIQNLDETSKKEVLELLSEDPSELENKYNILKESSVIKLETLKENQDNQSKNKIEETIKKIKNEKFNSLNYYKLKQLFDSL